MIRTWQERCEDFDDSHITTHQDIKNMMMDEIEELRVALEVANAAHRGAEAEVAKWKRLYENTIVQGEGMELYDEIKRLNERVQHLEDVITKGVWPK